MWCVFTIQLIMFCSNACSSFTYTNISVCYCSAIDRIHVCLLFIWATKMSVCRCRWANTSTTVNWHSDSIHVVNKSSFPFSVSLPHLFIISTSEMDKCNPMMFKKEKGQHYWKWQHTYIYIVNILIKSKMNNLRSASGIQLSKWFVFIELYVW